ncbi:MAG: AI-2E family transporter [Pseudomonadota bacterium]
MTSLSPDSITRTDLFTWFAAVVVLGLTLQLHLLSALIAGLLVYELVHVLASRLRQRQVGSDRAKLLAVGLISIFVVAAITAAVLGIITFLRNGNDSLPALLQKLADIIEASRGQLPQWSLEYIPSDADELRITITEWLRKHSGSLPLAGTTLAKITAHILIGMVVGALLALKPTMSLEARRPVARAIADSAARLGNAFRRVVFAQAWIATINTVFTAIYLAIVLPMLDIHLPLVKTMIAVTFLAGLMPILGNLISNTVIVLVSLSVSVQVAVSSLIFLVSVHKLEYFLNARIIGSHIRAQAWELLIAMVIMDAMFGIPGLIAAPIFYAFAKDTLTEKGLI